MEVLAERPPIYDECVKRFPGADVAHAIFSWGDRIYNLSGAPLSHALLAHEMIHCAQQATYAGRLPLEQGVVLWWRRYLHDTPFRLTEELLAHAGEFRVASMDKSRHERRALLTVIARRLASPLYGRMIALDDAKDRIRALAFAAPDSVMPESDMIQ